MHLKAQTALVTALAALIQIPTAGAQAALPLKHSGKPTQAAITPADAMTRLYIFADDSMMGRRTGSEGERRGTAYLEREVRRLGLVPAGDNGTFFQSVPLYTRTADLTAQLLADDTPVSAGRDFFPIHPGGSPRAIDGAQVIYAGNTAEPGSLVPAERTAGKVVFFSGTAGNISSRYPDAAAFMTAIGDQQVPGIRNFVGIARPRMKSAEDTVRSRLTILVPASSIPLFLGVPLASARPGTTGRTLRGEARFKVTDMPGRNVVAILPGGDAKLKRSYVALGAHSDHLGMRREGPLDHDSVRAFNEIAARIYVARTGGIPGFPGDGLTPTERASLKVNVDSLRRLRPARSDSIYNGADDDGSGSVGLLEIAEMFASAKAKPRRSLLFVWHSGEESGLFGSKFFTDNPTVPRDSIVAQLNVDMIGRGEAGDLPGGGPGYLQLLGSRRLSKEFGDMIEKVNKDGGHGFTFDYQYDANGHPEQYYCRSDHYEYARYGIPIVFMSTGGHVDYHQVTDEPQYISYPHLARVARFVADVARSVANRDARPKLDGPKPDPAAACVQ